MIVRGPIIFIVTALAVTRCQVSPEVDGTPPRDAPAEVAEASPSESPPTAPLALRMWLEQQHYRDTWELWPGTEPLHPGTEPHGALHTTWLSPSAMDGLERGLPVMPTGAVVLLGEHTSDSLAAALNVMIEMEGSAAEGPDWIFARFGSAGEIEATATCANCHVSEPDWIFSGELGIPLPVDSTGATAAPGPS